MAASRPTSARSTGPVPSEVRQLLAALNHFMQRLQANLTLMQTFLADAAHQIRTPLATLRAQADLAVEEEDAATLRSYVYKIHRNAALASQVTNQLLSHTMVAHRGQLARARAGRPGGVAAAGGAARRGRGGSPPIELDLRALEGPALIDGDPITLREAFTNLIDNARNYAGDQYPVQIRRRRRGRTRARSRSTSPTAGLASPTPRRVGCSSASPAAAPGTRRPAAAWASRS